MKRSILSLAATLALAGGLVAAGVAAAPKGAAVVIRHQLRGCHSWSFNGGAFNPALAARLARGGTITFVDDDLMPHQLIEKSGPAVRYSGNPLMHKMGASVRVTFPKAGVYVFGTKAGEDYVKGVKTIGEDNVLRLTVTVS
jgi:plastocyanin